MSSARLRGSACRYLFGASLAVFGVLVVGAVWALIGPQMVSASPGAGSSALYLPMLFKFYEAPLEPICRLGVAAAPDFDSYPTNALRLGWYQDWRASVTRQNRLTYAPMIRLTQVGSTSYSYAPSGPDLAAAIAANPGAIWQIGNEPDRRSFQDDILPEIYAQAYHDLYYLIKAQDPSAQITAGSIVQATPLRLQYLDMVLSAYVSRYGGPMPVDVWNIHGFILNEVSCTYNSDPYVCWGADIPPGIDAPYGVQLSVQDNDNVVLFQQYVLAFRQWMAARGYQSRPLIISEFGVLMPPNYYTPDFTPARVNAFMNATFDWLSYATDATGYPYDGNRLVQRWAWYSLSETLYNGWLFDPTSKVRTQIGDNYAAYAAKIVLTTDLAPVRLWVDSATPSSGGALNVVLAAQIANRGNTRSTGAMVRFYNGDPAAGGSQIGTDQPIASLDGCASMASVATAWSNVTPGSYTVYVKVGERTSSFPVTVAALDAR